MMIKILFLAANPHQTARIRLDEEIREIRTEIAKSRYRDRFEMVSEWALRVSDLQQVLLNHCPHIVHFSGHGSPTEEIVLEDDNGNPQPVSTEALSDLFRILKDNARLVVLNSCFAAAQANAITAYIDCAIGMKCAIGDQAAIKFAASLYGAIASCRSVREAFELGKNRLLLERINEADTPELFLRDGVDAATIRLCEAGQLHSPAEGAKSTVTLRFDLDTNDYNANVRNFLVAALALYLKLLPVDINITGATEGSVNITIELPESSANSLREAYQRKDLELINQLRPLRLIFLVPQKTPSFTVIAERSREWLLPNQQLWSSFVTVLAFGKRIHSIFQELETSHTQSLLDTLSDLLEKENCPLTQQQKYQAAWVAYSNRHKDLMSELRREFPNDYSAVFQSFLVLQSNSGHGKNELASNCFKAFQEIKDGILEFADIHAAADMTIAHPERLAPVLNDPKSKAATLLGTDMMRLNATSKGLAVNADGMLRLLIELIVT